MALIPVPLSKAFSYIFFKIVSEPGSSPSVFWESVYNLGYIHRIV
jgi:hypothetical protein